MTNDKPSANNEPNNHDVNNSTPKNFAGSNEPSSFSQIPLTSSRKLKLRSGTISGDRINNVNKLSDILVQILSHIFHTT